MSTVYLVSGGTGFVGNNIIRALLAKGAQVRTLVRNEEKAMEVFNDLELEIYLGDIRSESDVRKLFRETDDCEYIFIHTAAVVEIGGRGTAELMHDVNVNGTKTVLEVCRAKNVKRLVYINSVHAIPEPPNNALTVEPEEFNPDAVRGAYAKTKAAAGALVFEAALSGLDAVLIHPSGIIGPHDYGCTHMTQLVLDFAAGKIPAAVKGGFDFVDVRDVANAAVTACYKGNSGDCWIISNRYFTVRELLDTLADCMQKPRIKLQLPMFLARLGLPFLWLYFKIRKKRPLYTAYSLSTLGGNANFSHLKADVELGYKPRPFDETVRDTAEWLRKTGRMPK